MPLIPLHLRFFYLAIGPSYPAVILPIVASLLLGYMVGAIPFGVLVAKWYGISIFEHGSGNPGATNVLRVLGKTPGYCVFFLDAAKGIVPILLSGWVLGSDHYGYFALLGALLGHGYSIFVRFKGGKGVATLIGGLTILVPLPLGIGLTIWLIIYLGTRYVSLASIGFAISLPLTAYFLASIYTIKDVLFLSVLAFLVLWRHRSNCIRLLSGKENRF